MNSYDELLFIIIYLLFNGKLIKFLLDNKIRTISVISLKFDHTNEYCILSLI